MEVEESGNVCVKFAFVSGTHLSLTQGGLPALDVIINLVTVQVTIETLRLSKCYCVFSCYSDSRPLSVICSHRGHFADWESVTKSG